MATLARERNEYSLFHMVNFMIKEARRNEDLAREYGDPINSKLFPSVDSVVESLTRQAPNRVYFGPDGIFCRVLFYSEPKFRYQARIEILQLQSIPKILRSERFSTSRVSYLEDEISFWRRRFGMEGDLLLNPLLIMESVDNPGEILHVGGNQSQVGVLTAITNLVYCRYYQSSLTGPRFIGLGLESDSKIKGAEEFKVLAEPPDFLLRHTHPFNYFEE